MSEHEAPGAPCLSCDGTGLVETAAPDSRIIHYVPCPACGAAGDRPPAGAAERALVEEYVALLAHDEPWQLMPAAEPAERDYFAGARHALERLAGRIGVRDLHERARAQQQHAQQDEQDARQH